MRPDAVVVLMRMVAGTTFVVRMAGVGRRQVFVIALVGIVIIVIVCDHTDRLAVRMVVIARVRRRSGAAAHQVLSNERNEHHP